MEHGKPAGRMIAQAAALAERLESGVSKGALAHEIATREVVRGMTAGRSPAQIEADVFANLSRHEEVAALRRMDAGRAKR